MVKYSFKILLKIHFFLFDYIAGCRPNVFLTLAFPNNTLWSLVVSEVEKWSNTKKLCSSTPLLCFVWMLRSFPVCNEECKLMKSCDIQLKTYSQSCSFSTRVTLRCKINIFLDIYQNQMNLSTTGSYLMWGNCRHETRLFSELVFVQIGTCLVIVKYCEDWIFLKGMSFVSNRNKKNEYI